jgi:hypothetical protein
MAVKRAISPAEFLSMVSLTSLLILAVSLGALGDRGTAPIGELLQRVSTIMRAGLPH